MESNASTTSSAAPRPVPHDLPALPGSDLARIRASIDAWDHIPTARTAAADDEPVLPRIPGPRKPYDAIVLGQPHAWAAF